jgi:hypothetical protein
VAGAVLWDWDNPLGRYTGETSRANAALQDYVDLGPGRSLAVLARGYRGEIAPGEPYFELFKAYRGQGQGKPGAIPPTRQLSTLEGWSSRFQWQARLSRYQQIDNERREAIRETRRQELEDLDWKTGKDLRDKAVAFLAELPKFQSDTVQKVEQPDGSTLQIVTVRLNTSISQLSQALRVASELQRLSIHEPTDITEYHGASLLTQLIAELDELAEANQGADPEPLDDPGTALPVGGGQGGEAEGPDPED